MADEGGGENICTCCRLKSLDDQVKFSHYHVKGIWSIGFRKYWFFSRKISCELLNFPAESFFKWTRQLWTFPGKLVQIAPTWCMTTTLMPITMLMRIKVFSTLGLCCELRRGKIVGGWLLCLSITAFIHIYTHALYINCGVRSLEWPKSNKVTFNSNSDLVLWTRSLASPDKEPLLRLSKPQWWYWLYDGDFNNNQIYGCNLSVSFAKIAFSLKNTSAATSILSPFLW